MWNPCICLYACIQVDIPVPVGVFVQAMGQGACVCTCGLPPLCVFWVTVSHWTWSQWNLLVSTACQHWGYRHTPSCQAFMWFWGSEQSPHAFEAGMRTLLMEPSPQSPFSSSLKKRPQSLLRQEAKVQTNFFKKKIPSQMTCASPLRKAMA